MTAWLASIVGVVIIGVVIELLIQGRRMGNFVRSIYGFIVLFVIVSPLPNLLKADWWSVENENLVNTELVENLKAGNRQTQVNQILRTMGYQDALVTVFDNTVYVNLGVAIDDEKLTELQKALGDEVVII